MNDLIEIDKKVLRDIYNNHTISADYFSDNIGTLSTLCNSGYIATHDGASYVVTAKGQRILNNDNLVFLQHFWASVFKDVVIPVCCVLLGFWLGRL